MGSEKYPDENEFDVFIKKHGGSDNACTDCERVNNCVVIITVIKKNNKVIKGLPQYMYICKIHEIHAFELWIETTSV